MQHARVTRDTSADTVHDIAETITGAFREPCTVTSYLIIASAVRFDDDADAAEQRVVVRSEGLSSAESKEILEQALAHERARSGN